MAYRETSRGTRLIMLQRGSTSYEKQKKNSNTKYIGTIEICYRCIKIIIYYIPCERSVKCLRRVRAIDYHYGSRNTETKYRKHKKKN